MATRSLAALLLGLAAPLGAQESSEPRMLLSLFGGVSTGAPLWEVNRQPLFVLGTELAPRYDTLRISRRLNAGFALGITGTVFRSATLGLSGEMLFLGLTTDDACEMAYETPGADAQRRNAQVCSDIAGRSRTPTTVALSFGGMYRPFPRAAVSPYLRAQAGFGIRSGGVVEMTGAFGQGSGRQQRLVVNGNGGTSIIPTGAIGAGLLTALGPGYQLRLELRNQVMAMPRVTGPADQLNGAAAPTTSTFRQNFVLTAGLDIVLEQKRGRRY